MRRTQSSNTPEFDWFNAWHPIVPIEFLDNEKPHKFKLLGMDIVIWNDGPIDTEAPKFQSRKDRPKVAKKLDGNWRCFVDQCPHRKGIYPVLHFCAYHVHKIVYACIVCFMYVWYRLVVYLCRILLCTIVPLSEGRVEDDGSLTYVNVFVLRCMIYANAKLTLDPFKVIMLGDSMVRERQLVFHKFQQVNWRILKPTQRVIAIVFLFK